MFYKKSFVIVCLSLFGSLGCGSPSSVTPAPTPPPTQASLSTAQKTESTVNPKAQNLLTFDLLGGVFKQSSSSTSSMTLDLQYEPSPMAAKSITTSKVSINQLPPETRAAAIQSFTIDSSYTFVGYKNAGRLVVTAAGAGQEAATIRHFEPLTLRFLFFNYAAKNDCLGIIHIDGEIRCELSGDYKTGNGNFSGSAHCVNGPQEKPETVIYITDKKNYDATFDANLKIEGDYLNYGSYTYQGDITIDGVKKKIEDLISAGLGCS